MPMLQSPLAGLFTQRNRIISGLSLGVLVIEAMCQTSAVLVTETLGGPEAGPWCARRAK